MPWNLVCGPWVSSRFYKITIIWQLTKLFKFNKIIIKIKSYNITPKYHYNPY